MTQPTPSYLTDLRQGIISTFSLEDLITLCSDLGVDYETLGGQGKEGKARELIAYLVRRGQLAPLAAYCARERPHYPWPVDPAAMQGTPPASAQDAPIANLLPQQRASLQRQLAELRENLRLIEERESQFVQETDIPLQLVKEKRSTEARVAGLEQRLAALAAGATSVASPGPAADGASPVLLFDEAHGQGRWFGDAPTTDKGYGRLAEISAARARVAILSAGEELTRATLNGPRGLILPLGPQGKTQLSDAEIEVVRDFVRAGGSLLVLGAYTGDWHHEANLNRLIEEYGIVFNRDVVMPGGARPDDGFLQGTARLPTSPHAVAATPADEAISQSAARIRAALTNGVARVLTASACSLYVDEGAAVSVLRAPPDSVILEPVPLGVGIHIQRYMERGRAAATVLAASTRSKVVVAGSWKIFLEAFLDDPTCANQQLWRNILAWFLV